MHRRNEKQFDELERIKNAQNLLDASMEPQRSPSAMTRMAEDVPRHDRSRYPSPERSPSPAVTMYPDDSPERDVSQWSAKFGERIENLNVDSFDDSEDEQIDIWTGQQGPHQPGPDSDSDSPPQPPPRERARPTIRVEEIEEKGENVLVFIAVGFTFLVIANYLT